MTLLKDAVRLITGKEESESAVETARGRRRKGEGSLRYKHPVTKEIHPGDVIFSIATKQHILCCVFELENS